MQNGFPTGAASFVAPLAGVGASDIAVAGGKGANLGELVRSGFPVPDGFVITTDAYRAVLEKTPLGDELRALIDSDATGETIRGAFASTAVPVDIRGSVVAAYRALGGGSVAVRSSATAEDLPGAAFAGQQDTYLDVRGEDAVVEAVRDCWASLWTDRAIAYRHREGTDPREVTIAVVVQRMVPADTAGVMFSANPITGRRDEIVIDAARGLGESVVSGLVTPEHDVLAPDGTLRERTLSEAGQVLTEDQLAELARIAGRAAQHFGRPQDMEWAFADGTLFVLQARPMTALPPDPTHGPGPDASGSAPLNAFQKRLGPFFLEMFQQRPYPLDVDGWLKHVIVAMLHRMAGSVGVGFPPISGFLPEEDGVVARLVPPVPHPTPRVLAAPVSVLRRVRRFDPSRWTEDPRFVSFRRIADEIKAVDLRALGWPGLLAHVRRIFAATSAITDLRVSYLPAAFVPQLPMRIMLLVLGRMDLGSALIAGADTRTAQANRALAALAVRATADAALARAFGEREPSDLLALISSAPAFADFDARFHAFLAEYGHRETVSIVLSSAPTWADAPESVLGLVKVLMTERGGGTDQPGRHPAGHASGHAIEHATDQATDQTGDALRTLLAHPLLRLPRFRRLALAVVQGSKVGTGFREDSHFYLTLLLPALRRTYAEIGERLVTAGVLERASDVYHLRFEELSGIAEVGSLPPDEVSRLRATVEARIATRAELEGVPMLDPAALFGVRESQSGVLLTGMGSSRGTATGRVRIITDPAHFGELHGGEILVCAYTNPAWTPLFQRAAGVVVDTGGMGSHAAIVAREYGIPAVMGTGNGTRTLVDGQLVTVDGTNGRVLDTRS